MPNAVVFLGKWTGSTQTLLSAGRTESGMFLHKRVCSGIFKMNSWIDMKMYLSCWLICQACCDSDGPKESQGIFALAHATLFS